MNPKRIYSIFLLLFGEALIIISFLYFLGNLDPKILKLNIVVTSLVFFLFYFDIFFSPIDFKDKSHKEIGSIGLKGIVTIVYLILIFGAIRYFIVNNTNFNGQLIVHGILFFFLLLGLYFALSASTKVQNVYKEELLNRNRLVDMRKATKEIQQKLDQLQDIPVEIISRMNLLQENLRFVSPSNNPESNRLQSNFLLKTKAIQDSLFESPLNHEQIIENIKHCEIIYSDIKQNFSN